ncbi:MAG TPA: DUF3043 domain-containing protein [Gemmataceae bacterium]|nr:DUF3043 domain-containing protein [Gemmataceae bacterium]
MFRRSRTSTDEGPGQDAANGADATSGADAALTKSPAVTAGKGRPTPKRSDAERRRRQPYTAPKDRKEASRVSRDRQRADRARRMEAVRRGEEWALPPRDRGPGKALARDYVDSKRRVSEYYMYGLLVLLVLLFVPSMIVKSIVPLLVLAAVLVMAIEGIYLGRKVKSLAAKRLPGESTRGLSLYAAMRALQIRRLRVPKPRVKPGDSF